MKTVDAARGKWRTILSSVGVRRETLDGKHHPCPMCGGKDRFRFDDLEGNGTFICGKCGAGHGFQFLEKYKGWPFKVAAQHVDVILNNLSDHEVPEYKSKRRDSDQWLNRVWNAGKMIAPDCPVDKYLRSRGLIVDGRKMFNVLRYAPKLRHFNGQTYPGMLAKFFDFEGNAQQIQRSFLTVDGQKATAIPHRMNMAREMAKGGAIRLGDAAPKMGIAEGVETALSAAVMNNMPVWATTSKALLKCWKPPAIARHIIVFGDNDKKGDGQAAAWNLAWRLLNSPAPDDELKVEVKIPEKDKDWNDVLQRLGGLAWDTPASKSEPN